MVDQFLVFYVGNGICQGGVREVQFVLIKVIMKAINVKITATTTLKDFETSNPETTSIICFEITSEKLT